MALKFEIVVDPANATQEFCKSSMLTDAVGVVVPSVEYLTLAPSAHTTAYVDPVGTVRAVEDVMAKAFCIGVRGVYAVELTPDGVMGSGVAGVTSVQFMP